ncbi:MAG: methylenetetrahydrofolate reductase, partial [Bacillota bacterium]
DIEGAEPRFFVGAAANPFADPFEFRVIRLAKKVKAGADFIQTQAIYDVERFAEWMKAARDRGLQEKVHILAGLVPPKSAGALRYMKNNVSGMRIPDALIRRMRKASDPRDEGINITVEIIQQVREIEGVHGVHIMPIMWEEALPVIVERAGLLPRPQL